VSEKSGVDDVLVPMCSRLRITYVPLGGMMSYTRLEELRDKMNSEGRPARVGYVSDCDPAGIVMPRQLARYFEYWTADGSLGVHVAVRRLVLTRAQVDA
jgi:hypothetical protein